MRIGEARERLEAAGIDIQTETRLGNDTGDQLRCANGAVINVYDSGSVVVQGREQPRIRELLGITDAQVQSDVGHGDRRVFVVYGHDEVAKTQLEAMLRRWRLEPLILDQLPSEGQTLIEKLEKYARGDVGFAVVLATPDDEGYPRGKVDQKSLRARQNVVLELGLLLAKLGRPRVAVLLKNQEQMERPSDIQGIIYLPFTDNIEEVKVLLAKEMDKQGIAIDVGKL